MSTGTDAKNPAVSVVLPAFNVEAYIEEAVASVFAQTFRAFELIVIDDGSKDRTAEVLDGLAVTGSAQGIKIRVIHTSNRGVAAARNIGIEEATAPLIAFLDGDDRWADTLLERAAALLADNHDVDLVFPNYRHIDAHGRDTGGRGKAKRRRFDFHDIFLRNPIHSTTGVIARRYAIERAGNFDEQLTANVDFDLWLRISALRSGNIVSIQEVLADYRQRSGQITESWQRMAENWEIVLTKTRQLAPQSVPQLENTARANSYVYWSMLARREGDLTQARRLIAGAWKASPWTMVRSWNSWVATLVALATFLPARIQRAVVRLTRSS
jgi:glycosyltransferase involved in cell wall biosynthesis